MRCIDHAVPWTLPQPPHLLLGMLGLCSSRSCSLLSLAHRLGLRRLLCLLRLLRLLRTLGLLSRLLRLLGLLRSTLSPLLLRPCRLLLALDLLLGCSSRLEGLECIGWLGRGAG